MNSNKLSNAILNSFSTTLKNETLKVVVHSTDCTWTIGVKHEIRKPKHKTWFLSFLN